MPKLEYFVVCRSIATEVDSDELTLSNVLEDVVTDGFPDYLPKLMAISVRRIGAGPKASQSNSDRLQCST